MNWDDGTGFLGLSENPNVAENQALYERGLALIEDYEEAERDCANQINADLDGRTRFEAMPSDTENLDDDAFYHGYADDLADVTTEWESGPAETDLPWWGDAGTAVWDFGVGAVVGAPLLAWRGAAILDGMGGRGGSGGEGADLDVDLPNGQRYGGPGAPVVQIDANTFDTGDFTPDQLTGMRDSLNRVQNLESGSGAGSRPTGPTTRPTADEDASPSDTSRLNRNEDEVDLEPTETSNRWGTDAEESGTNTTTDTHSTTREGNDSETGGTSERSSTGENGREPTTEQLSESDRLLNQVDGDTTHAHPR